MKQKIYLCVLHSSVAQCWLDKKLASEATDKILDFLRVQPAIVPAIWHIEMADFMQRQRNLPHMNSKGISERQSLLLQLPIHTDDTSLEKLVWQLMQPKENLQCEMHYALYIALAKKMETPLVTLDENLRAHARAHGLEVLP